MTRISINLLILLFISQQISASSISVSTSEIGQQEEDGSENFSSVSPFPSTSETKNTSVTSINTTVALTIISASTNSDNISTKSRNIDTELADLLDLHTEPQKNVNEVEKLPSSAASGDEVDLTVIATDDRSDTEEVLRGTNKQPMIDVFEESDGNADPSEHFALVQGRLTVTLAGIFVAICIVGYGALLFWRRFLENRYGHSQMLDETDDDHQREDLKYFSI